MRALPALSRGHVQALLLPQYWSSFIRSGSLEDVRPLGLGAKP
jgi:hypothetical protein